MTDTEIVPGDISGGATTSHTILVPALRELLLAVPSTGAIGDYESAVLDGNVLGKDTDAARRRTLRYLKQLYLLKADSILFRALRDVWADDAAGQPLLAGLCALARDPVFRASSGPIVRSSEGDVLTSGNFGSAVGDQFPDSYNQSTLAKIGRNTFSSWEQAGHLAAAQSPTKVRARAMACPANTAYALLLGHLQGFRGAALFDTLWASVLDQPNSNLMGLAFSASQRGMLEFRHAGGVIDVGFRELLRPFDNDVQGQLL